MIEDFKSFPKIERWRGLHLTITQKLNGTNAQIYIYEDDEGVMHLKCGSRNRWLAIGDDNYGFCAFVESHRQEFIDKLGVGRHFGEWCGPGINSGEGLAEKTFVLFDWERFIGKELPHKTLLIPILFDGILYNTVIDTVLSIQCARLLGEGSQIVNGFNHIEGVVIKVLGQRFKLVFSPEETKWTTHKSAKERKEPIIDIDISHLLQPVRMEKLLSRDERYIRDFPQSLPDICRDYIQDLIEEKQIVGDDDQQKDIRKKLGSPLFRFAKEMHTLLGDKLSPVKYI